MTKSWEKNLLLVKTSEKVRQKKSIKRLFACLFWGRDPKVASNLLVGGGMSVTFEVMNPYPQKHMEKESGSDRGDPWRG